VPPVHPVRKEQYYVIISLVRSKILGETRKEKKELLNWFKCIA
jgi:hypothetical protein